MTLDVWYTTSGIFCQFSFCSRNNYFRIISQSWIGHYFYSNIYGCAPRGVRRTFCFCTNIQPKLNKIWQNVLKLEKSIKKWLFCNGFSKFVQFGLNIGSKTHQVIDPLVLLVFWYPVGCIHSEDMMVFVLFFIFLSGGAPYSFFQRNQNKVLN